MVLRSVAVAPENQVPLKIIFETLSAYYGENEINSFLEQIIKELGFERKSTYTLEEFMKMCRELKKFGGNASFCGSLLIIKALSYNEAPNMSDTKDEF